MSDIEQRLREAMDGVEEGLRLAEVGEYLYNECAYSYGDGRTEPREYGIEWQWQQAKPDEYGQGKLLAASTKWHAEQAADGIGTEATKLRDTIAALRHAKEKGARTLADERAIGARPYMVAVRHGQILGWKAQRNNCATVLTQLRLAESKEEDDGEFGVKQVPRVRVLAPGSWAVYMPGAKQEDDWVLEEQGTTTLKAIPFAPVYGRKRGFMDGVSPLLDLAYLNVKHWQSQSDQDTILHVARVPILLATGFEDKDDIKVGASTAIKTTSADADLKWVEHTGKAIDAGKDSLSDLEDQMIQAGAELLIKKPGANRTATESAIEADANKSDLQRIVEGFEDGLDQALQFMADYAKLGTGGSVSLFKDFGAGMLSDASAQMILSLEQGGLISKETAINEYKRRGTLAAEVDSAEEAEKIAIQDPAPSADDIWASLTPGWDQLAA